MEILVGLIVVMIIVVLSGGLFMGGAGIIIFINRLFDSVATYWEQSFRYPLRLDAEKNILVWLYITIVAYLLFFVLFVDMNVAGASARVSSDVINLRRFTNSVMGVVVMLLNLPLLPLIWAEYPLQQDNRHLARVWRLWKVVLWVILFALFLAVLSSGKEISAWIGKGFQVLYFWWNDVRLWLDADAHRTINGFNYPAFQYVKRFFIDLMFLTAGYWPFAYFHNSVFEGKEVADQQTRLAKPSKILPYE